MGAPLMINGVMKCWIGGLMDYWSFGLPLLHQSTNPFIHFQLRSLCRVLLPANARVVAHRFLKASAMQKLFCGEINY
jgi:hypothetical protein